MATRKAVMLPLNGEVMEAARERRCLERRELAQRVGHSYSHIYNLETGRKWAKKPLVNKLARVLEIPVDDLIDHEKLNALREAA